MIVGLTGSIAMGKSETARLFSTRGVPVFDSDFAVHELYSPSGAAVEAIGAIAPAAIDKRFVDRKILAELVARTPPLLKQIEAIVHPLVQAAQEAFVLAASRSGAPFVVIDIPLLFETGRERELNRTIVVSAPADIQRRRALSRSSMSEEKLDFILSKQMPDVEKRRKADFVIDNSGTLENTAMQVDRIISTLMTERKRDAGSDPRH